MKDEFRTIKSRKTYWDWVGSGEEERPEPAEANPDMLPEPEPEELRGDRMLKMRAIQEANLTQHEVLVVSLLANMTQEEAARHLGIGRSAIADALGRARCKIERKLAILRAQELLANKDNNSQEA